MGCFVVPMTLALFTTAFAKKMPEKMKMNWLNLMLWGGVLMLTIEHLAHEEIVPYFPFFTQGFEELFPEMVAVGVPMTLTIIAIWLCMVVISNKMQAVELASAVAVRS